MERDSGNGVRGSGKHLFRSGGGSRLRQGGREDLACGILTILLSSYLVLQIYPFFAPSSFPNLLSEKSYVRSLTCITALQWCVDAPRESVSQSGRCIADHLQTLTGAYYIFRLPILNEAKALKLFTFVQSRTVSRIALVQTKSTTHYVN